MSWIDAIDTMPFARAVPVVNRAQTHRGLMADHQFSRWDFIGSPKGPPGALNDRAYVDLDDPQGFGYALRWAFRNIDGFEDGGSLERWLVGEVTEADRLGLARAIAEVMG